MPITPPLSWRPLAAGVAGAPRHGVVGGLSAWSAVTLERLLTDRRAASQVPDAGEGTVGGDSFAPAVTVADVRDCVAYDVPFAEWGLDGDQVVALLESLEPDDFVAGVLRRLDTTLLTDAQRARVLGLWERHSRWTSAQQHDAVLAVAGPSRGRGPVADLEQTASEIEIGFALGVTDNFASEQISTARTLQRVLTRTAGALRNGDISAAHVRTLVTETRDVDAETARAIEDVALRPAHRTKTLGSVHERRP